MHFRLTLRLEASTRSQMRGEGALKHFIAAFLIAGIGYWVLFYGIEHLRTRNGPWTISFTSVTLDRPSPAIVISQPELKLQNVTLSFPGEPLPKGFVPSAWVAAEARQVPFDLPFGSLIFLDTTVLPGTVTMRLFGHEIELIPRTIIIDHLEYPWVTGTNIQVLPLTSRGEGENPRAARP